MIKTLLALIIATVSCFAQVNQAHLRGTTSNVQDQLNAKLPTVDAVATNISISGTFTPTSQAARTFSSDADTLYLLGDSISVGALATAATNTYAAKISAAFGLPFVNLANNSFNIADMNWSIFPGWTTTNSYYTSNPFSSPSAITEDQNWTFLGGYNDVRSGGTTAAQYRLALDHLLRYLAIPDAHKRWAVSPDASTGFWTPSTWTAYTNKAATSSSGTLTFSNVIGSEVYVGFVAWATNYGGTISVSVDGTLVESRATASAAYGNRVKINGADANIPPNNGPYGTGMIDFCPHVISATGLGVGAHTVVVTASANPVTVIWVAGNGFPRSLREGPNVIVGSILRQSPWTAGGTDASHAAFNAQLRSAVNSARSAGLRVAYAPTGEYYNPATGQSTDLVHPNNSGHVSIAQAFEQTLAGDMPQMAGVGYQTPTDPNLNLTTLNVSGQSFLTGVTTFSNGVLVYPTAGPGGFQSRFGIGGASASAVQISHSDTALDRRLALGGNSISSVVNSTGAGANMTIGTAGVNVAALGAVSVAQAFTASTTASLVGDATLGSRLFVYPTAQSGGFSSRFGLGGLTSSAIQINHSDTALDRQLVLGGNSIAVTFNSTGAGANLSIGTSGFNTAIQGTASVAQALTASSTLAVAGAITASTNVTVTGRFLNLPAAASGGLNSRFGGGNAVNSSISITHSDSDLNHQLNVTGARIWSTQNSSGASTNLSLGASGTTTAIAGATAIEGATTLGLLGTAMTRVRHGVATLTAGSVTISDSTVTASSRILLTSQVDGGTPGWLRVSARTASTSFTITSSSGTDTSTVAWMMVEP